MMGLTQDGNVSEIEDLSSDEEDGNPVVPAPVQVPNSTSEPEQESQNEDTVSDFVLCGEKWFSIRFSHLPRLKNRTVLCCKMHYCQSQTQCPASMK